MAQKKPTIVGSNKGSRAERLASVISGAKKAFGSQLLHSASQDTFYVVPRISTGLYGLDVATNGGFPIGRMTLVYGNEGSGKTNLLLRSIGDAQKRCANCYQYGEFEDGILEMPDFENGGVKEVKTRVIKSCPCGDPRDMVVLWVDLENVWHTPWAIQQGVEPEKVMLVKAEYGEQAYDIITAFVTMKDVDIIGIDSLANITPADEYNAGMGEQSQGLSARLNNKFIRKIISGMSAAFNEGRPITLLAINQYREKIGVMFGDPRTCPGGRGQRFAPSIEIECGKGKIELNDSNEPLLSEFYWTVKKNKVGVEGGKGNYQQCSGENDLFDIGEIMEHDYVIDKAVDLGFIGHPNKVTYEFSEQNFRGKGQLKRFFGENKDLYNKLKDAMLKEKLGLKKQ